MIRHLHPWLFLICLVFRGMTPGQQAYGRKNMCMYMNILAGLFLDEGIVEGTKDHQMCFNDSGETTIHTLIVAVGWFTPCLPQK